jgi:hypothetical protein
MSDCENCPRGEGMAKDASETFKLEESLQERLRKAAYSCDVDKSKLIRSCILHALPTLEENPALIGIIDALSYKNNKTNDR